MIPVHTRHTHLREKTYRVSRKLERAFGTPTLHSRRAAPLDMLIATILSQNTNDKNSHRAYLQLRKSFPTWKQVVHASARTIASAIRVGGMANRKSVRIKRILKEVRRRYGSLSLKALEKREEEEVVRELTMLDGVGAKTAACVLLFSFGRDVFPVDTHVHRICGRLGLALNCKTPEQTFEQMQTLIPKGKAYSLHINLIQFGRKICRSQRPLCGMCPLYDECTYSHKSYFRKSVVSNSPASDYKFMLLDHVR